MIKTAIDFISSKLSALKPAEIDRYVFFFIAIVWGSGKRWSDHCSFLVGSLS